MYKQKFSEDFKFGLQQEDAQFDLIKKIDCDLVKTSVKSIFDYESKNSLVELKSRNNTCNQYPTTMVAYDKIEYAHRFPDKKIYFCFKFTDGLYYYQYNKDDNLEYGIGGRRDRGRDEIKSYCYIPIKYLINLE